MTQDTHHPIRHLAVLSAVAIMACLVLLITRAVTARGDVPPPAPFTILTPGEQAALAGAAALTPPELPRCQTLARDTRQNPPAQPDPGDVAVQARRDELVAYVTGVMDGWPKASLPSVPIVDVATSIANVTGKADDAILLAGIGYFEGARYAEYVDSHLCNDPMWRRTVEGVKTMHAGGDCDHSKAHSLWQIHPIEDKSSPLYALCNVEVIDSSRENAARCALELAHGSLKATGSLANYTGEWPGPHPAADVRLEFVRGALQRHPFTSHVISP